MRGVSVETRFERGRLPVRGDRARLQQALVNVMVYVADAMAGLAAEEWRMTIETGLRADGWRERAGCDGDPGVSPQMRDGAFRPFRTTRSGGPAPGLSRCRSIAETHHGNPDFDKAVNREARVVLAPPAP
jgi:C4-dicarboxylate-specific signal transduction histidine kinase